MGHERPPLGEELARVEAKLAAGEQLRSVERVSAMDRELAATQAADRIIRHQRGEPGSGLG